MHVLWDRGELEVVEIAKALDDELAPSTIRTLLGILMRKGMVKRRQSTGRAHLYRAATARDSAERRSWRELSSRFLKSPAELALHVLEDARLTGSERARLAELLRRAEGDE